MNRTNRFKENSPATASFFDRLRSIPAVSGEVDCMDELGRLSTPYLHRLEAVGGRNHHLRRSQGRRLQNCSLAPGLLEVVKLWDLTFWFYKSNPEVSKRYNSNPGLLKSFKNDF